MLMGYSDGIAACGAGYYLLPESQKLIGVAALGGAHFVLHPMACKGEGIMRYADTAALAAIAYFLSSPESAVMNAAIIGGIHLAVHMTVAEPAYLASQSKGIAPKK